MSGPGGAIRGAAPETERWVSSAGAEEALTRRVWFYDDDQDASFSRANLRRAGARARRRRRRDLLRVGS